MVHFVFFQLEVGMMYRNTRRSFSVLGAIVSVFAFALLTASANAALLSDEFDDGDLTTNTLGTGSGFSVTAGAGAGSVTESGGLASVFGNIWGAQSNDAFDPTGKSLTVVINDSGFGTTFDFAAFGWVNDTDILCCAATGSVNVEFRTDRMTLDLVGANTSRGLSIANGSVVANEEYV